MKKIDVVLSPEEDLPPFQTWLVVDILRATTNIVNFFDLGGKEVIPAKSIEDARLLKRSLGSRWLLAGESNMFPPADFDLGNSPLEYSRKIIERSRGMVLATTNGTSALLSAAVVGRNVLAACARNASSVASRALELGGSVAILCSGRNGRAAMDDILCAGLLVKCLIEMCHASKELSDGAHIALKLWSQCSEDLYGAIKESDHAGLLQKAGLEEDIRFCSMIDETKTVPFLVQKGEYYALRVDNDQK